MNEPRRVPAAAGNEPMRATRLLFLAMMAAGGASVCPGLVRAQPPGTHPAASPLAEALAGPIADPEQVRKDFIAFIDQHVATFRPPAEAERWFTEADRLRRRLRDEVMLKGIPDAWVHHPPNVQEVGVLEPGEGYRIRKLRYEVLPGLVIPALLYEPTTLTGRMPVMLNPNGHARPKGKAEDYKQARCINEAKRGIIALSPEWIAMGELRTDCHDHNRLAWLDLCGRSGVGVFYLQLVRALDVLLAHPNADTDRVGVTGLSGGGWQTIVISALDPRVTLAVPDAGYITIPVRARNKADVGDLEQIPTDLGSIADYSHLTAMLAPRPALLIYNAKDNCCFPADRARPAVFEPVRPLYVRLNAGDAFAFHVNFEPGTHNYERDNREALYRFLNAHFFADDPRPPGDIHSADEILSPEELTVGVPEPHADFCTLADAAMTDLPKLRVAATSRDALTAWQRDARKALRTALRYEPVDAKWKTVDEAVVDGFKVLRRLVRVDGTWTIPVVEVHRADRAVSGTTIVLADAGRAGAEPYVRQIVADGRRAIVVDVLLAGETCPANLQPHQVAMLINTVGARTLGIAAAQLAATTTLAADEHQDPSVSLIAIGRQSCVTALAATAFDRGRIAEVTLVGAIPSLKTLIEERVRYNDAPYLFTFGLLEQLDVRELVALALPRPVHFTNPTDPDRLDRELRPLDALAPRADLPRVGR
jgi:dienelactone hydrolase